MINIRKQIKMALKENKEKEFNLDYFYKEAKRRDLMWAGKYNLCSRINMNNIVKMVADKII